MIRHQRILAILIVGFAVVAGLRCGSDKGSGPVLREDRLTPDKVTLEVSSSQQFEAVFDGETPEVWWYVDGLQGGSPETGMITPEGLYVAPAEVTEPGSFAIMAVAVDDTLLRASARVNLEKNCGTAYVEVTPGATTVAVFDSVEFEYSTSGCSPYDPTWSLEVISGASSDIGVIDANGTYTPPRFPDSDFELMIMAKSETCVDKTGIARLAVKVPTQFYVELEDFTESSGTGIIRGVGCGGGVGVTGLDEAGEWVTIAFTIPAGGRYIGYIRYGAGVGDRLDLTLTVEDGIYGTPTTSFILDAGSGVGG